MCALKLNYPNVLYASHLNEPLGPILFLVSSYYELSCISNYVDFKCRSLAGRPCKSQSYDQKSRSSELLDSVRNQNSEWENQLEIWLHLASASIKFNQSSFIAWGPPSGFQLPKVLLDIKWFAIFKMALSRTIIYMWPLQQRNKRLSLNNKSRNVKVII